MPFFSIIIPCYNQAHYLVDCLDSLLAQSFNEWEAFVINDGSTDHTNELVATYMEKDNRIKLIEQHNQGLSAARNAGIKSANGKRLIFLDADDFFYDDALAVIFNEAELVDDATMVQYGYAYITEQKESILRKVIPVSKEQLIPDIFYGVPGPCHTLAVSKALVDECGSFDTSLKSLEDWDFWIRAVKCGAKIKTIPQPLVYYRYVKNSMSRNAFVMFESFKKVASRAIQKDERISHNAPGNKAYNIQIQQTLNGALIRMLGVSIMQGKIEASVDLFTKESSQPIQAYKSKQFEEMCSYLSFRYWYSKADIEQVLTQLQPLFKTFFESLGCTAAFTKEVLFHIFKRHYFYRNINRYGRFIGSFLNYYLRKKYAN